MQKWKAMQKASMPILIKKRKQIEAQQADADDLKLLEDIERRIIDQNNNDKQ